MQLQVHLTGCTQPRDGCLKMVRNPSFSSDFHLPFRAFRLLYFRIQIRRFSIQAPDPNRQLDMADATHREPSLSDVVSYGTRLSTTLQTFAETSRESRAALQELLFEIGGSTSALRQL